MNKQRYEWFWPSIAFILYIDKKIGVLIIQETNARSEAVFVFHTMIKLIGLIACQLCIFSMTILCLRTRQSDFNNLKIIL